MVESEGGRDDGRRRDGSEKSVKKRGDGIGGTAPGSVARGKSPHDLAMSRRRIRKEVLPAMSSTDRRRYDTYLHGPNKDLGLARLRNLKADDADRDTSKLSDVQRLALERRARTNKRNRSLRTKMDRTSTKRMENALEAKDAEDILHSHVPGVVEAENDMERTSRLVQTSLKRDHLDEQTARQVFDLTLTDYAPYSARYDRSGRYALLTGKRGGHVSIIDQHSLALKTEFHVNENIRDATFLHNGTMMAVAQRKNVFIYDDQGAEIHRLPEHDGVHAVDFLPYHWLLATVGHAGWLKFQDTSTGNLVSNHRTKLGPCRVMRQNPSNAVMHLGHGDGSVTLWSPASPQYLAKMLCHRGAPVLSLAVDRTGRKMVTGGADGQVKIWDLRTYKELFSYYSEGGPATSLDVSQTGMLAVGHGCRATFWGPGSLDRKSKEPYMKHVVAGCGPVESVRFRPFEDVACVGHTRGISSAVIPGCGEPNLDSTEYNVNPYQDTTQRKEAEVRSLMDKLSYEMIALDPDAIAAVEESRDVHRVQRARDLAEEANALKTAQDEERKNKKDKNRMRGRSKIKKKLRRKRKNIVDENAVRLREVVEKEKAEANGKRARAAGDGDGGDMEDGGAPAALKRFFQ